tara:strand:+ start:213 stop:416 length:204 start_codon:yes stop_codon:yes gene_type:complete
MSNEKEKLFKIQNSKFNIQNSQESPVAQLVTCLPAGREHLVLVDIRQRQVPSRLHQGGLRESRSSVG